MTKKFTSAVATLRESIGSVFPLLTKACDPSLGGPCRRAMMNEVSAGMPADFGLSLTVAQFSNGGDARYQQICDEEELAASAVFGRGVEYLRDEVAEWLTDRGMQVVGHSSSQDSTLLVSRDGEGNFLFVKTSTRSGNVVVTAEFCSTREAKKLVRSLVKWGEVILADNFAL